MKLENIIGDYERFLDKIFDNLKKTGISVSELSELDHIAYRTENILQYNQIKEEISVFFSGWNEKVFGGRLILVGRFKRPLKYKQFAVKGFELLAPKNYNKFSEGLEHAEFVIEKPLPKFYQTYKNNVRFNLSAYKRDENPELIIDFADCAVKFHEESLLNVRSI
jgi:predicted metalloenzyme YecM